MKMTALLVTCMLTIATADAKSKAFETMLRIIPLNELTPEKIQEFTHSKESDFTVELKEGTTIPLQFLSKSKFFSAALDPNLVLKVEKTCYVRVAEKKCYMSEDMVNWEKFEKFLDGKSAIQLVPNTNKPGFTLETNIIPNEDETDDEGDYQ